MTKRVTTLMLVLVGGAAVLLVGGSGFYTDLLWFQALGYEGVFWRNILYRAGVRLAVGLAFASFMFVNLLFARREMEQALGRLGDRVPRFITSRSITSLFVLGSIILGFLYSTTLGQNWEVVMGFLHAQTFGRTDPLFGRDIGYFVFKLPFYRLLYGAAMGIVAATILVVLLIYVLSRSISFADRHFQVTGGAKYHLTALAVGILLLKAWDYRLQLDELVYSPRGGFFGASYTDVYAEGLGLRVLLILALVAAVLLVFNLFRRGMRGFVVTLIGLAAASLILGDIYPGMVQRYVVEPNELERERPFIEHHIQATLDAYGLADVDEREYPGDADLDWERLKESTATLDSIRLWDWRALGQTYGQLQEMRLYYQFPDVDVDRYMVDGQYRQVMLSAREIEIERQPVKTWVNTHLQYTHGYGIVMSPVNEATAEGLPKFFISDIPPKSSYQELKITRPEVYYGERTDQYVIVNTRLPEFDYPLGEENALTRYEGRGGVQLTNFLRRAAFALRFGTSKILLSGDITRESRLMFRRTVKERVREIAPFLRYDPDPYIVLDQGRLFWVMDAYTITDRYPYSQPYKGWGNYVRGSVKVIIDAYHGTVDFYIIDDQDPLIKMYSQVYPGLFKPIAEMSSGLQKHLRYPEELFQLQTTVYALYHMRSSTVFYNREDLWEPAREVAWGREQVMSPYYVMMRLEGEAKEEFVLMLPFTPARRNNMVAWMAVRCDGDKYGQILVYRFPKQALTYGPAQIEARIDQDTFISQQLTLWSQTGSQAVRGNLLVIPIAGSLLYVEPLYLQAEQSQLPELKMVIVAYKNRITMQPTFQAALQEIFGRSKEGIPQKPGEPQSPAELIRQAVEYYNKARSQLQKGDWMAYGEYMAELETVMEQLESLME